MSAPIEWAAISLPDCQIRIDAHGKAATTPISVRVDGVEVASGRGTVSWTGIAFTHGDTASVVVGDDPPRTLTPDVTATVTLTVPGVLGFDESGPEARTTRAVPIDLGLTTSCRPATFTWTASATPKEGGTPITWTGAFTGSHADASRALPVGQHVVAVDVLWQGTSVATSRRSVYASSGCMDSDNDGSCSGREKPGWDCDDQDPYVRPGLPDLLGDGRDNDCDGKLAGDADGDGYDGADRPPPTPEEWAQVQKTYDERHELAGAILTAAPKLEADCDDHDPLVHPWAGERGLGGDDDCNGKIEDWKLRWKDGGRLTPTDDGSLQVQDHGRIRTSGVLSVPDWHPWDSQTGGSHPIGQGDDGSNVTAVLPLQTGAGHVAWLVVVEEHDTWAVHSFTGRVGFVLVAGPGDALVSVARLDLGRHKTTMGEGTSTLVVPVVSVGGITVGTTRYTWTGDTLAARP